MDLLNKEIHLKEDHLEELVDRLILIIKILWVKTKRREARKETKKRVRKLKSSNQKQQRALRKKKRKQNQLLKGKRNQLKKLKEIRECQFKFYTVNVSLILYSPVCKAPPEYCTFMNPK